MTHKTMVGLFYRSQPSMNVAVKQEPSSEMLIDAHVGIFKTKLVKVVNNMKND